jgi:hypothetical protein
VENLLRPWILALLLASVGAALAWLRGLTVALSVLRGFRHEMRDEAQIKLERKAELGARFVELGALASAASFGLLIFGADHAAAEVRGAMCAHGVLGSTRVGFLAASLGLSVFVTGMVWSELHRLDLELHEPRLTRPKFVAFAFLAPLALASAIANVMFARELDFGIVATCCSASLDTGGAGAIEARRHSPIVFPLHLAALGIAAAASLLAARRPSRRTSSVAGGLSLLGVALAVPAVIHYVAPHVYETPSHRCPFCLLHWPDSLLGVPLYASMALALFGATSLLVRLADPRWASDEAQASRPARRAAALTLAGLIALMALMIAPVASYHLTTGGASLFGANP